MPLPNLIARNVETSLGTPLHLQLMAKRRMLCSVMPREGTD